jgi:hypothetical protein
MTLERVTIISGLATLVVTWIMGAVAAWQVRRPGGHTWRGYCRGFLMMAAGLTVTEGRLLLRLPHEFTMVYVVVAAVGLGMAMVGFVVVVRAHRSEKRPRASRQ